jgi:DNA-binding NarL/FixJ family response regulator
MTVRVGIADDQSLVRDGFRVQLGLVDDLEFVGEASTGEEAVELARRARPDVLLMDVRMPVLDGIAATERITADPRMSSVRVLVLTTFDVDEYVFAALRAGASGFLLKDVTPEQLFAAIRVVAVGDALLAPTATRHLVRAFVAQPSVRSCVGRNSSAARCRSSIASSKNSCSSESPVPDFSRIASS